MPLDEIIRHSKLPVQCRYDMERLGREYDQTVAPSIERSRYEKSHSPYRPSKRVDSCKPLTKPVPHGNYVTSPVFTKTQNRSTSSANHSPSSAAAFSPYSTSTQRSRDLPNIPQGSRTGAQDDYLLKESNYNHATRVRNTVAAHEGTDAHRAYTQAFLSYTGRSPTAKEVRAADQYNFIIDPATGRDVIADNRTLSRLSNTSGKSEFYYLKRLPQGEPKKYPAFRNTMTPNKL
eukprot:GILI01030403.1.p1 GENE.GILI01030403.1~~GILI01030403.1.p1  ORF type:complete len:233 (+),score=7.83 GILI01030403.1:30-728(+)